MATDNPLLCADPLPPFSAIRPEHVEPAIDAILADTTLPPELRDALEQALAGWRAVECHPASISVPLCPLTTPGQSLH